MGLDRRPQVRVLGQPGVEEMFDDGPEELGDGRVVLDRRGLEFRVVALIDTGAPATIFDSAVAEPLGIRLGQPGASTEHVTILGGTRKAERHLVHLTLPPFNDMAWETEVLFLRDELDVAFAGLLGTVGFLDRWVVSFNYYDNYFVVEERDSFQERIPKDMAKEFLNFDSEWAPPGR